MSGETQTERAFLAGLLAEPQAVAKLVNDITPTDFQEPSLGAIWAGMVACHRAGELPELAAVIDHIKTPDTELLSALLDEGVTSANCPTYAHRIRQRGVLARLAAMGQRLKEAEDPTEALTAARADLDAIDALRGDVDNFRPVDMSRLGTVAIPPPRFVIESLIPCRQTTLFGGHGGTGKSLLALTLGAHVACGRDWHGLSVRPGSVLFVSMEDDADLVLYRLQRIANAYDLPLETLRSRLSITDASDAEPLAAEVINSARVRDLALTAGYYKVVARAVDADLVIIDNASDAFAGDEINRRQVRAFIKALTATVRPHGGACLLLAHIDKLAARNGAGGNSYSGSTAWHNSARSRLALIAKDDHPPELHQEKLNLGKKLEEPLRLRWTDDGILIPDDGAAAVTVAKADDAQVLAAIEAAIEAGETIPTSVTGSSTAWHRLRAYPELPELMREKPGKRAFDDAVVRLQRANKIERQTYRSPDRKEREKWGLRLCAPMCADLYTPQMGAPPPSGCAHAVGGIRGIGARAPIGAAVEALPAVFGSTPRLDMGALAQRLESHLATDSEGVAAVIDELLASQAIALTADGRSVFMAGGKPHA